eukprot:1033104-Prymnesium_polylepis.2
MTCVDHAVACKSISVDETKPELNKSRHARVSWEGSRSLLSRGGEARASKRPAVSLSLAVG